MSYTPITTASFKKVVSVASALLDDGSAKSYKQAFFLADVVCDPNLTADQKLVGIFVGVKGGPDLLPVVGLKDDLDAELAAFAKDYHQLRLLLAAPTEGHPS